MSDGHPPVMHFAVHEPDGQYVMFTPATAQQVLVNGGATTLTAYFAKNAEVGSDDPTRQILYHNFPAHFTWHTKTETWKDRRRQTGQIGRVYTAHPSSGERFYIRLLLCLVAGTTSSQALRTLDDGEVCETFHEACRRRLLLQNDGDWNRCLQDAIISQTSTPALRQLFVTLLRCCQVQKPLLLWNRHCDELAADFLHQAHQLDSERQLDDDLRNLALLNIGRSLRSVGSSAVKYGLREPQELAVSDYHSTIPSEIRDELRGVDRRQLHQQHAAANVTLLNADQRAAYDAIMDAHARLRTDDGWDGFFFVDGPGGTGKAFLYDTHLRHSRYG
ncbi:unnamed protein product [Sphacelaria rigidula]